MTQTSWQSNGHSPRRDPSPTKSRRLTRLRRNPAIRYVSAILIVLFAWAGVLICSALFSTPPFLLFALAIMLTAVLSGFRPGLLALALAILLSDFFFVHPTYELSMNGTVFRISLYYLAGMLLSYYVAKRASASHNKTFFVFPF